MDLGGSGDEDQIKEPTNPKKKTKKN